MNQEQYLGLLRDLCKVIGAALMAKGAVTAVDWTTYTGIILTVAPLAWSAYERTKARMVAKVNALPEVKGVITTNTAEGKALAEEVPAASVAPAGSVEAAVLVTGPKGL